ncbi:ABC transporter permease [Mucilaginibacter rigui]|uniref:ABC transporter permease n=1 Tax=Mucilaginibacter rigui TaxID=534635 RepID=A0ABR7X3A1_9SPHI|nr:ABC transporter permease [Mucilaginibacter rigui]MBD1384991.1 ABC transporter permease [Mucilaginibacter rigui]
MFKNYIKTAFRSLKKNKGFTIINILGLALGLCVCMLIVFYVIDELSYDKYNTKIDRIYRVNNDIKFGGATRSFAEVPAPLAATFMSNFPEVEKVVRFRGWGEYKIRKGNQNVQENSIIYADPGIFDVFTLPMLDGDPVTALKDPHSIVINQTMAKKYFNTTNAVGKTLLLNDSLNYKVTGVIKDIPKQSHFRFGFFLAMTDLQESKEDNWLSNNFNTYVLLKPGAGIQKLEAKFPAMVRKSISGQLQAAIRMDYDQFEKTGGYFHINLTPLQDIHLRSNRLAELDDNSNIQYVYIFSAIALFILLIACVNFMNLSTARSANRAREVGVRKVLGSPRKFLIAQFLSESVIVTFVATVIAVFGAWALLPLFNQTAGKEIVLTAQTFAWLVPALLGGVIVIGCLAGSYPAFFLSAFQPIDVLKGKLSSGFKGGFLRSFLVVFQFSISIFLIIGTMVIYHQLKYIQSKNLGYDRDHVLVIKNTNSLGNNAKVFKRELQDLPGVQSATLSGYSPTSGNRNSTSFFTSQAHDSKTALATQFWDIDEDYVPTMGMKVIAGRNFSKEMMTDSTALVINETAARQLAFTDPVGKELYLPMDNTASKLKQMHIIGVVKDFNFNSLRDNVTPLVFQLAESNGRLSVRIKTSDMPDFINQVKSKWQAVSPNMGFDYSFMDEEFDSNYRAEQRIGTIFIIFTTMAIIIACLGLFGLAAYAAEQRTKEIGIRKVLGANVSIIVGMLSKDFIKLVIISILIASPLAWLSMQQWLKGFAYRDGIKWWIIVAAGAGAMFIAVITISFQSIKAALVNPVKSLKSE